MVSDPVSAFGRLTRFGSVGLVIDMNDVSTRDKVRSRLVSLDAINGLRVAVATDARYAVLAGQLMRKKGGAFCASVRISDVDLLCATAKEAFRRVSDTGETNSLWIVLIADSAVKQKVTEALASVGATAGSD